MKEIFYSREFFFFLLTLVPRNSALGTMGKLIIYRLICIKHCSKYLMYILISPPTLELKFC